MLPNLLIIGAQKCGTTSLHRYLDLHPDVHMAAEKELDFFIADRAWANGADWYAARFRDDAAVRGEASPNYTGWPVWDGVPERAAWLVPDARLVYLVRDPIERIESHYLQRRLEDGARGDIDAVIGDPADPRNLFVARSRYATQLERWLACFPQEQVLVLSAEELRDRRHESVALVLDHVGLDGDIDADLLRTEHHRSEDKGELPRLLDRMPVRIRRRVRGRPVVRQQLPASLRARLIDVLSPEVERLRALTGRRFAEWSL